MKLILNSTPLALWQEIVHDAEISCAITLKEELEAYLVFLLTRYTNKPEIVKKIMATQFLRQIQQQMGKEYLLKEVGDECLLFSGLFPKVAESRHVKISYFVGMGQTAYAAISKTTNDLYDLLAKHFVALMDILLSVRQYTKECPDLLPIQAYDLWNETGSQRALQILKHYSRSQPVSSQTNETPCLIRHKGIH